MSHTHTGMRVAGGWLAIASLLLGAGLVLHGPIDPDMGQQMQVVADSSTRWAISHWASAAGLSLFAVTGLIVLAAGSRLTEAWWTMSAWAVLAVATFEAWWAFSEGKATGFMFVALAVAAIAGNEARTTRGATPVWASWIAAVAGIGAFFGWALSMWFGVGIGSLVWLASSLTMCLWTLWFGLGLPRTEIHLPAHVGARSSA